MAFVILHYNNINDTVQCINSIQKLEKSENCLIVVVDNKSPNGTGRKIKKLYQNDDQVRIILCEKNFGFSIGNNIGYFYAKKQGAQFITICNNDVIFDDNKYIQKTLSIYKTEGFFVLGPDIYNPVLGVHQSPLNACPKKNEVLKTIFLNTIADVFFNPVWLIFKKKLRKFIQEREDTDYRNSKDNVPLMGACLIFSSDFIAKNNKAFIPCTFLYYEEYLLYNRLNRNNQKMIYRPELSVIHKEGGASITVSKNEKQRYKRLVHNTRVSAKIFYDYLWR